MPSKVGYTCRFTVSAHLETGFARALAVTHAPNAARGVAKVAAATQVDRHVGGSIVSVTESRYKHGINCQRASPRGSKRRSVTL